MQVKAMRIGKNKTAPAWTAEIVGAILDATVKDAEIQVAPERIVRNWDNKPTFKVRARYNYAPYQGMISLGYVVGGEKLAKNIWRWLDEGTKPHKIRPKTAKSLAFLGGPYEPKTRPGGISLSFGGPGAASGDTVFAGEVNHPGTEPREFYVYLANELLDVWADLIHKAIQVGIVKAWSSRKKEIGPDTKRSRIL